MPVYPDLEVVQLFPEPEKFWRSLHEPLGIQSVLDVGSGHSGVHDCGYWTARPMSRRATCDIFRCRDLPGTWEATNGVDVLSLSDWYTPRSFDLVQCLECLEHVEDSRLALEQLIVVARKIVIVSSADEMHHRGPGQEAAEAANVHQRYVGQPAVRDLLELGFTVKVEAGQRQLLAWKLI